MTTPAGWYQDTNGAQRFWDGATWTDRVAPSLAARTLAVASATPAPRGMPIATPPGCTPMSYEMPAGSARRRVWPWVLGIVGAVLVVIIGLVIWLVVALSGSISAPFDAVNAFESAVERGDCAAMQKMATPSLLAERGWDNCAVFEADAASLVPSSFDANSSSTGPSNATVKADIYFSGDITYYVGTFTLIEKDGEWRVDSFLLEPSGW